MNEGQTNEDDAKTKDPQEPGNKRTRKPFHPSARPIHSLTPTNPLSHPSTHRLPKTPVFIEIVQCISIDSALMGDIRREHALCGDLIPVTVQSVC